MGLGTAEAWIGIQFDPDVIPEEGIDIQCVTIGANALVNELLWALQVSVLLTVCDGSPLTGLRSCVGSLPGEP